MSLIKAVKLEESEILNKWIESKFRNNQNVLLAVTGSTGSSKSYCSLRICELWYRHWFKDKEFPVKTHTCFSIAEVLELLDSGELEEGELIILEEAGTNLAALDFQKNVSKMFTFILQSFRSMNIGLIFNLPYLSMLNKQARLLIHAHFITTGIDYEKEEAQLKPLFRQVNQTSGKIYEKYLRIKIQGKIRPVTRFTFKQPSKRIRDIYEPKKTKFVSGLTKSSLKQARQKEKKELLKQGRKDLTHNQLKVFKWLQRGFTVKEIAKKRDVTPTTIYSIIKGIRKKGYDVEIPSNKGK